MRSPIPLRRRPVWWLLLPAVPLLVIVAQLSPLLMAPPQWWTWTVSRSVLLILIPAAVGATGAALEASRLRARRLENPLVTRGAPAVLAVALWPPLLCAVAMQLLAVAIVALTGGGTDGDVPWPILGTIAAMLFFHTCFGFALGSLLRPVFGIPVALAGSYAWLGFTGTMPTFELRHLAGLVIETCCTYDQQPIAASLVAATLFSVLAGVGLLVLACTALRIARGRTVLAGAAGAALIASGLGTGLLVATGLPPSAAEPRDPHALVCTTDDVTVCLFPEQADSGIRSLVADMLARVRSDGVDLPALAVASDSSTYDPDRVRLTLQSDMSEAQIALSMATDLPEPRCPRDAVTIAARRDTDRSAAVLWLQSAMLGTAPSRDEQEGVDEPVAMTLRRVLDQPRADQVAWINSTIESLRDCSVAPPVTP